MNGRVGDLNGKGICGHINYSCAHYLADSEYLASLSGSCADLDELKLSCKKLLRLKSAYLDGINKLVELLFKLLSCMLVAVGNDGDSGNLGIIGNAHCKAVDIEASA